ncbi:MAG TPA: L,D-transpeptidase [Kofleriaceae bacterium]
MRWVAIAAALIGVACGGKKDAPPEAREAPTHSKAPDTGTGAQVKVSDLPDTSSFKVPDGTRSLQLTKTVSVRLEPNEQARRIGTIAIDTRVRWGQTTDGKGCKKPWVEIEPRGWVCSEYLMASKKAPIGREVPSLDRGELVPGTYGKVTAQNQVMYSLVKPGEKKSDKKKGKKDKDKPVTSTTQLVDRPPEDDAPIAPTDPDIRVVEGTMTEGNPLVGTVTVRKYDEITVGGKTYWKVDKKANEYILRSAISQDRPSTYRGTRFGDDTGPSGPVAFVWPRGSMNATFSTAKAVGGGIVRQTIPKRTGVEILETANDKAGKPTAYRIGDNEWIRAGDVRVFTPSAPPEQLEANERWIDIDLDTQILVAYEGTLAVYATMVSSGLKDTPTTTGLYRMWLKESEADMKNLKREDPYSVATVPWTQFFFPEEDLAIHTAYWHDLFGTQRSHGCVNVAPRDARWLYFWSDPQVPPGWTMAAGVVEAPGSMVRVRSKADPNPTLKGYAKKVDEARRSSG